jgi:hypothetical protein
VQAAESLLVAIYDHNLVTALEKPVTKFCTDAAASKHYKIHKTYSFTS